MAGKMMSNKKWSAASKAARAAGTTLNELIGKRDKGDKQAQSDLNKYIAAGDEATRESRAAKMTSTVIDDYERTKAKREAKEYEATKTRMDTVSKAAGEMTGEGAFRNQVAAEYAKNNTKKKKNTAIAGN